MNDGHRETILVVDDVPQNIDILAAILDGEYRVIVATNGPDALEAAQGQPGLILLDVMMPGMDGYEVCRRLKADMRTRSIPVIFVTALGDANDEELGLKLGAVDYLHKPSRPAIVRQRVRIHLELHSQNLALEGRVRERTRELEAARLEIVSRLGRAAEYRDNETGMHVVRMGELCHLLALAAGIPAAQAELLRLAAPMHDVGKIGIPDRILLKPGKLDEAEWGVMRTHPLIGAEILGDNDSELLTLARNVALTHHERWDGKGYPHGLAGQAIPVEGRIAAICDVHDALTSARPYKQPWSSQDAIAFIEGEAGGAFEASLVARFVGLGPEIVRISERYSDPPVVAA
jgi:putative two-component system response regulator